MDPPVAHACNAACTPAKLSGLKGEAQCQPILAGVDRTSERRVSQRRQMILGIPVEPEDRTPSHAPDPTGGDVSLGASPRRTDSPQSRRSKTGNRSESAGVG